MIYCLVIVCLFGMVSLLVYLFVYFISDFCSWLFSPGNRFSDRSGVLIMNIIDYLLCLIYFLFMLWFDNDLIMIYVLFCYGFVSICQLHVGWFESSRQMGSDISSLALIMIMVCLSDSKSFGQMGSVKLSSVLLLLMCSLSLVCPQISIMTRSLVLLTFLLGLALIQDWNVFRFKFWSVHSKFEEKATSSQIELKILWCGSWLYWRMPVEPCGSGRKEEWHQHADSRSMDLCILQLFHFCSHNLSKSTQFKANRQILLLLCSWEVRRWSISGITTTYWKYRYRIVFNALNNIINYILFFCFVRLKSLVFWSSWNVQLGIHFGVSCIVLYEPCSSCWLCAPCQTNSLGSSQVQHFVLSPWAIRYNHQLLLFCCWISLSLTHNL